MRIFQHISFCLPYLILVLSSCNSNVPEEQPGNVLPKDLSTESLNPPVKTTEDNAKLNENTYQEEKHAYIDSSVLEKDKSKGQLENGTAIATSSRSAGTPPKAKEVANKVSARKRNKKDRKREKKVAGIAFDSPSHPYGNIRQGDIVEHQFYFTNTGTAPLTITNVKVSCGCTQPSYPFIPIEPGEKGYIGVTFDSKGKLGKQKPTITVITNASPSTHKLYLEGYVDAGNTAEEKPEAPSPEQTPSEGP